MASEPATESSFQDVPVGGLLAVWEFAVHVVVGSLIFLAIAAGTLSLDLLNRSLETAGIDPFVRGVLKAGEYAVVIVGLVLFLVFLFKASVRAAKRF